MKRFIFFCLFFLPLLGFGQIEHFTADSIPVVGGKVVFSKEFMYDLKKEELRKRVVEYLNKEMNPYSGVFLVNDSVQTHCRLVDYVPAQGGWMQAFGMYMTYRLQFFYEDGKCWMVIQNISYMEKQYFEAQEQADRKLDMPEHSAEAIMVDKSFSLLMVKNVSDKVTESTLKRINGIITSLHVAFAKR